MKKSRFLGGVILMLAAAAVFIFDIASTPAAITLLIVGIALAATAGWG
jgi:hypothetical protein